MKSKIKLLDTSSDKAAEKVIQNLITIGKSTVPSLIKAAKNKEALANLESCPCLELKSDL